jgi:ribose transport system ATP-binding protein
MDIPLLEVREISKAFGNTRALNKVRLKIERGRVHALIGENGAGKSTLMKILSGAYSADSGEIFLNGKIYSPKSPAQGRDCGIAMIYQELTLAPHLTVEENITLGMEESACGVVRSKTKKIRQCLDLLGHGGLDLNRAVSSLSIGLKQIVEIARAIYSNAEIIIMDEPTSSLSKKDAQALFDAVRKLKERNIAVIYISHFLEEAKEIADDFTVLRDGETVAYGDIENTSITQLIEYMVGRKIDAIYPKSPHDLKETILEVKNVKINASSKPFSFSLRRGEILGIAGLVGAGRTETLRRLFGLEHFADGKISLKGRPDLKASWFSPERSLKSSFDLLSENRKEEGLAVNMSLVSNITLSALNKFGKFGFINLKKENEASDLFCKKLSTKYGNVAQKAESLSGGNQQKVAFARLLLHDSDIFFLDEPTRGIDIGSKTEIYKIIMELAAKGKAVVVVSSYLPELTGICDTLAVMHRMTMSPVRKIEDWTEKEIMSFATTAL